MANHTIDCPYCGEDQRLISNCCKEYAEAERRRKADWRRRIEDADAFFKRVGFDVDLWVEDSTKIHIRESLEKFMAARGLTV